MANPTGAQLYEVMMGLEASGHPFIWVVRIDKDDEQMTKWLPKGYEARLKGKGLIVRGWAPFDHEAVGGFVTHCGWNWTLEGVCAGVPMVTWPLFAEQFLNEKLVTEILRIWVEVGVDKWVRFMHEGVKRDAIDKAVKCVMVGEEAEQMRNRAKALKEMAKKVVEDGGSSYSDLNALIGELKEKEPK